ncbi:MAG: photosynthetic complex putative assembly protein PuhB [Pseudomonadota bacterium]
MANSHTKPLVTGLLARLPEGERLLWQGQPKTGRLAREAFGLHWVAAYFAVLAVWRAVLSLGDMPPAQAIAGAVPFVVVGAIACAVIWLMAFALARSASYAITSARVVLQIGAITRMSINLPFSEIERADLVVRRGGVGSIVLQVRSGTKLPYLAAWPHVRPWRFRPTQPALRAIPDAAATARLLAEANAAWHAAQPTQAAPSITDIAAE